mgnify:CR=1 FL=1
MSDFYYEISASIISCIIGIVAILVKQWQTYRDNMKQKQYELLKFRLEKFYFPIYIKLRQDKHLSDLLDTIPKDEVNWEEVDSKNLKNHNEVLYIFNDLVSTANPRSDILKEFMKYEKHTNFYSMMRQLNITGKYPKDLMPDIQCAYPTDLLKMIHDRIVELRIELNFIDLNGKSNSDFNDFDDSVEICVARRSSCL